MIGFTAELAPMPECEEWGPGIILRMPPEWGICKMTTYGQPDENTAAYGVWCVDEVNMDELRVLNAQLTELLAHFASKEVTTDAKQQRRRRSPAALVLSAVAAVSTGGRRRV